MRLWLVKIVDIDVDAVVEDSAGNSLVTADSLEQLNNSTFGPVAHKAKFVLSE